MNPVRRRQFFQLFPVAESRGGPGREGFGRREWDVLEPVPPAHRSCEETSVAAMQGVWTLRLPFDNDAPYCSPAENDVPFEGDGDARRYAPQSPSANAGRELQVARCKEADDEVCPRSYVDVVVRCDDERRVRHGYALGVCYAGEGNPDLPRMCRSGGLHLGMRPSS